jgi:excisionase family DNA binding protein
MNKGLPRLLTAEQLAQELGLPSKKHVYRWREEHGLPAYQVGRSLLFDVDVVREWLGGHRAAGAGGGT